MSVWVCSGSIVMAKTPQGCEFHGSDGKCLACGKTGKPCDAVEYAEVKRGKWIGKHRAECSVCHGYNDGSMMNYCGFCGAKMEW